MNAFEVNLHPYTLEAGADLTGKQYFGVKVNSSSQAILNTVTADITVGVLQTVANAIGKGVSLTSQGISKAVAGAAIAAGVGVEVDAAGKFVTLAAGNRVGTAITAAGADGAIFSLNLDK